MRFIELTANDGDIIYVDPTTVSAFYKEYPGSHVHCKGVSSALQVKESPTEILAKIEAASGEREKFWLTKEEAIAAGMGRHDHIRFDWEDAENPICLYRGCEAGAFPLSESVSDFFAFLPPLPGSRPE